MLLSLILCGSGFAADLLIEGGMLWDGTGAPRRGPVDVLVQGDRVVAVGEGLTAPAGARVLDARGATVLPGLIDSHVHLSMDPGAAWRSPPDAEATHQRALEAHLQALLEAGVTTVLDPAVLPAELARIRATLARGAPGPRYLTLGTPFSPEGGYVSAVIEGFPGVSTVAEVDAQLNLVATQGTEGLKVTVEPGMVTRVWPLLAPELRLALRDGARARGLAVYAHAMTEATQALALDELGATVMVHPPEEADAAFIARLAREGIYEMTTLAPTDAFLTPFEPARLFDPLIQALVPADERISARDPDVQEDFVRAATHQFMPRLPFPERLGQTRMARRIALARVRQTGETLRALQAAGVPLVLGSDSGNWPIIPHLFHGWATLREIELLGEAGLRPEEVLLAATRTPAKMLHREGELGAVLPGAAADLLIVEGDPLRDLSALRRRRWTVYGGVPLAANREGLASRDPLR